MWLGKCDTLDNTSVLHRSTKQFLLTWIVIYYYTYLSRIVTKFNAYIHLWLPYTCTKFQPNQSMYSQKFEWFFWFVWKEEWGKEEEKKKKNWNFGRSFLRNGIQIWNVASQYRQARPQQICCSSDKTSQIHECIKIYNYFIVPVNMLTPICTCPELLGPHNPLPYVLITNNYTSSPQVMTPKVSHTKHHKHSLPPFIPEYQMV